MSSCGKNENPQEMNRRKFLKVFGGGAVASSAALYGCAPKNEPGAAVALGEVPFFVFRSVEQPKITRNIQA